MSDAEDQLWATISDKPGSSIKKGQVKALLGLSTDDATEEWLKTRPHLFKVEEAGGLQIVHATPRKPGFDGFHSQHALQTEIIAFLKAHQGPAHLGSHIGQFVKELGAEAKGRLSEYLRARPHLFHVSNQWVTLVEPQNSEQPARDSSAPRAQAGRPCCWTHADAFSTPVPLDTTRKSCEAGFVWPASRLQSASNSADREAAVATTNGKDAEEDQMEKAVVAFLRKLRGPAHLGQDIGPFIIQKFGESRKGQLGPFFKARQHMFHRNDMYISLVAARAQPSRPQAVAFQKKVVEAPPGFADHDVAASHSLARKGSAGRDSSVPAMAARLLDRSTQQALDELRQKYDTLERDVMLIKQQLQVATVHTGAGPGSQSDSRAQAPLATRIWVFGGHDGQQWMSDSRIFHVQKQEWRAVAELDSPLTFSAAASLHSHIYLFGGSSPAEEDESFTRRAQRFDIEQGRWLPIASMSKPRGSLAVSELGGAFFCVGGGTPSYQYDLAERYDPVSDRWTIMKPMSTPRFALASAVLKGSMVCVGGFDGQRHLASSELYDARAGRWDQLASMHRPRGNFSACAISEHELLAIGGYSGEECTAECEILDLRFAREWRSAGPLTQPRAFGATVGNGLVHAIGGLGENMSTYLETVEAYDVQLGSWSELRMGANLKQPSHFKRAFFAAVARG